MATYRKSSFGSLVLVRGDEPRRHTADPGIRDMDAKVADAITILRNALSITECAEFDAYMAGGLTHVGRLAMLVAAGLDKMREQGE